MDDYYDIDRIMYSDMLHTADKGDKTEWLEYFSEGVMFSLQGALARVKESLTKLKLKIGQPSKKEKYLKLFKKKKKLPPLILPIS